MSGRPIYTRRLVWATALTSTLTVLTLFVILVNGVFKKTASIVEDLTTRGMQSASTMGCMRNPAKWGFVTKQGSTLHAYNIQTLRSVNPNAPSIPAHMARKIRSGARRVRSSIPILRGRGAMLLRVRKSGPCSVLYIVWRIPSRLRWLNLLRLSSVLLLGLGLCLVIAYYGFVQPILKRIESLAEVAQSVGQQNSMIKTMSAKEDDLQIIEEGLQQANQQILKDKEALAAKNLALSQHIANMAHDLRTPIASLQLVLERMTQDQNNEPNADLSIALSDTVYLEQLTNNLSMATRLHEGLIEEKSQPLDLREVVKRVAGRLHFLARKKGLSLEFACPDKEVWVQGSDTLYERALSNLVHNAIRYGDPGGHVVLLLEATPETFVLKVMDDGPGVPPSEIPRLKDRMYRSSEARQRDSTGLGLGLAITHEICDKLEIDLSFEPIQPRGLCVRLSAPKQTVVLADTAEST